MSADITDVTGNNLTIKISAVQKVSEVADR